MGPLKGAPAPGCQASHDAVGPKHSVREMEQHNIGMEMSHNVGSMHEG